MKKSDYYFELAKNEEYDFLFIARMVVLGIAALVEEEKSA